jgi:hypothetical protein
MELVVLAALLTHLQQFESLFETEGVETITGHDGQQYNLFDIKRLYGYRFFLSQEEAVAIEVSLYHSANGHKPDDPYILAILRKLCIAAGVEYREPELVLLNSNVSGELRLLGGDFLGRN